MGNFVALPAFTAQYGHYNEATDKNVVAASWQSAFQCGGPVGAFFGVFLAGPITSKIGYRWATIGALMVLNAFIFVFYFGDSLPVLFVSQILEGLWYDAFIRQSCRKD
jgi:MFS transporter, SP family, general alpha glucoside:H+ symporter